MRTYSEHFLAEVEAFLTASRMRATDFGREAVGDPSFITRLRQGRSPSLATADKVRAYIGQLDARQSKCTRAR